MTQVSVSARIYYTFLRCVEEAEFGINKMQVTRSLLQAQSELADGLRRKPKEWV